MKIHLAAEGDPPFYLRTKPACGQVHGANSDKTNSNCVGPTFAVHIKCKKCLVILKRRLIEVKA